MSHSHARSHRRSGSRRNNNSSRVNGERESVNKELAPVHGPARRTVSRSSVGNKHHDCWRGPQSAWLNSARQLRRPGRSPSEPAGPLDQASDRRLDHDGEMLLADLPSTSRYCELAAVKTHTKNLLVGAGTPPNQRVDGMGRCLVVPIVRRLPLVGLIAAVALFDVSSSGARSGRTLCGFAVA